MRELRAESGNGERLFDYEPEDGTITIVKKKRKYTVKLIEEYKGKRYKIIEVVKQTK